MIIVTGGAGLIGSAVVRELNRQGEEDILVVDHLGSGEKWRNLAPLSFVDYLEKDEFLRRLEEGRLDAWSEVEAVVHLGACSATTERDAGYLVRNNFAYSKQLALWALAKGARFVYASSAATYGSSEEGFADDETRLATLRPLNMYGYSKQLFDLWAQRSGLLGRMDGLKYFNVFGPNEYHKGEMRSLVLKAFEQIAATGRVQLFRSYRPEYGDGEQVRDFLYVKDAAAMTVHFLANRAAGGIFNVGSGVPSTWNALVAPIFAALGKPVAIDYVEMPEAVRGQYQYYTCADIGRLRAAGYASPVTPLAEAVTDYVANYLVPGRRLGEEE